MKSTGKTPRKQGHNVVELPIKKKSTAEGSVAVSAEGSVAGIAEAGAGNAVPPNDARVKEAMRLAQAFLAIEDAAARNALVTLAEQLVSFDWVRKIK
jgi:hypothetical protein